MKILITGGNGFIASHLAPQLDKIHEVTVVTRKDFDLVNRQEVKDYFEDRYFDIVIHTCAEGGRRDVKDDDTVFLNNLKMYLNLAEQAPQYRYLFTFTSGADYDKSSPINGDINNLQTSYPSDPYGLSKNIIARLMRQHINFYNFRIYGVFGKNEAEGRFITTSIKNLKNKKPIEIHQDRYFDFVYIDDLVNLVEYYTNTIESRREGLPSELEVVYSRKSKLSDIAKTILNIGSSKQDIVIKDENEGLSYVGTQYGIEYFPLNFKGLNKGIKELYNEI